MGADFLDKRNKGYAKHIDRERALLATGDLLTRDPDGQPRRVILKVRQGVCLDKGDKLIVEVDGTALTAGQGNCVVADADTASPSICEAVSQSSGVATGTVEKVNKISRTVEVSIQ